MNKLSKQDAWALLARYTETPALQKHALQVAAAMEHFARLAGPGEDPEVWWAAGLLHDLDYEKYPEEHCKKSEELMRAAGLDEVYIRAMLCHGYGLVTDTKPESRLEKTLYTVDELTGLINAACLVRPSKSVLDLEVKSVKKKFKDKAVQGQGVRRRGQPRGDPQGLRDAGRLPRRRHPRDHRGAEGARRGSRAERQRRALTSPPRRPDTQKRAAEFWLALRRVALFTFRPRPLPFPGTAAVRPRRRPPLSGSRCGR